MTCIRLSLILLGAALVAGASPPSHVDAGDAEADEPFSARQLASLRGRSSTVGKSTPPPAPVCTCTGAPPPVEGPDCRGPATAPCKTWTNPSGSSNLTVSDCCAWQKIFDAMKGQFWYKTEGFKCERDDPCACRYEAGSDRGVYCSGDRIKQIDLSQITGGKYPTGEPGYLHEDIGNLDALEVLDVGINFLVGTVPSVFGDTKKLRKLRSLTLGWNHMHGQPPKFFNSDGRYSTVCDLGGDNPEGPDNPDGFDALTSGNNFACPLTPRQADCKTTTINATRQENRVKCSYCLPGYGCSEEDCPSEDFDATKTNPICTMCAVGEFAMGGDVTQYDGGARDRGEKDIHAPCQKCAKGEFQNQTGQASCYECTEGKYQDREGQVACINCFCDAGTASPCNRTTGDCVSCEVAQWSSGGYPSVCESCNCSAGTASDVRGATSLAACDCKGCAAGLYSPGNNEPCMNMTCDPGWASSNVSAIDADATCTQCPENTFSPGGGAQCMSCDEGQTSSVGSSACTTDSPTPAPTPPPTPPPTPQPTFPPGSVQLKVPTRLNGFDTSTFTQGPQIAYRRAFAYTLESTGDKKNVNVEKVILRLPSRSSSGAIAFDVFVSVANEAEAKEKKELIMDPNFKEKLLGHFKEQLKIAKASGDYGMDDLNIDELNLAVSMEDPLIEAVAGGTPPPTPEPPSSGGGGNKAVVPAVVVSLLCAMALGVWFARKKSQQTDSARQKGGHAQQSFLQADQDLDAHYSAM